MLKLTVSHASLGDKPITLTPEDMMGEGASIGRASRNQVVLEDPAISRLHARVTLKQGSAFLMDAGSTAGTALNGTRLAPNTPARLAEGDRIVIGPFTLSVGGAETGADALRTTIMSDPPASAYMPLVGATPETCARWSGAELAVRVQRIIVETPEVKTLVLVPETPTLFAYLPGQSVQVHIAVDGQKLQRRFTLSSSPTRPYALAITVRRSGGSEARAAGIASVWLHDRVAQGDTLVISSPHGDFSCARQPYPRLLLASAGIGITPMLSMLRWLTDTASEADVVLLHCARTSADLIARRELELLAMANPRLRLVLVTSRPETGAAWIGLSGRLGDELLTLAVPDVTRRRVFCCAPEPFRKALRALLAKRSFPMDNLIEESFGRADTPTGSIGGGSGQRTASVTKTS